MKQKQACLPLRNLEVRQTAQRARRKKASRMSTKEQSTGYWRNHLDTLHRLVLARFTSRIRQMANCFLPLQRISEVRRFQQSVQAHFYYSTLLATMNVILSCKAGCNRKSIGDATSTTGRIARKQKDRLESRLCWRNNYQSTQICCWCCKKGLRSMRMKTMHLVIHAEVSAPSCIWLVIGLAILLRSL